MKSCLVCSTELPEDYEADLCGTCVSEVPSAKTSHLETDRQADRQIQSTETVLIKLGEHLVEIPVRIVVKVEVGESSGK